MPTAPVGMCCFNHQTRLYYTLRSSSGHPCSAVPVLPGVTTGDMPPEYRLVMGKVLIPGSGMVVNIPTRVRAVYRGTIRSPAPH